VARRLYSQAGSGESAGSYALAKVLALPASPRWIPSRFEDPASFRDALERLELEVEFLFFVDSYA